MRGGFVIDNSVMMSWCFEDEASDYSDAVLNALRKQRALAPTLWIFEAANVLALAVGKKRLKKEDARDFSKLLQKLPIEMVEAPDKSAVAKLLEAADESKLTAYDAAYLELALREQLPIATTDAALRKAAKAAKIDIFDPDV